MNISEQYEENMKIKIYFLYTYSIFATIYTITYVCQL